MIIFHRQDSQEGHMEEDELLAEAGDEEGDDDVIEPAESTQSNLPAQTVEVCLLVILSRLHIIWNED